MNVRMQPRYFATDGHLAWFVEGFTSDDQNDWVLRFAYLDQAGKPNMSQVMMAHEVPWAHDEPLYNLLGRDLSIVKHLLGNWQRFCNGLPEARRYAN